MSQVKTNIDSIDDSELKNEIIDNVEGLQEELKKEKPKKGNFLYNEKTGEYVHSVYARIVIRRKL